VRKFWYRLRLFLFWPWVIPLLFIRSSVEMLPAIPNAIGAFRDQWKHDWQYVGFHQAFKAFKKGERL
jgi:hypothetical protein